MTEEMPESRFVEVDQVGEDGCGPIMRSGEVADAAMDAIAEDNPEKQVFIVDRGDYIRINTLGECRLTRATMERHLGRSFPLPRIEIEMPSFAGRIRTTDREIVWYHNN